MLEMTRFRNILNVFSTEIKTFLGHNSLEFGLFHVLKTIILCVLVCSSASVQPDNIPMLILSSKRQRHVAFWAWKGPKTKKLLSRKNVISLYGANKICESYLLSKWVPWEINKVWNKHYQFCFVHLYCSLQSTRSWPSQYYNWVVSKQQTNKTAENLTNIGGPWYFW